MSLVIPEKPPESAVTPIQTEGAVKKSDSDWKTELSPMEYKVLRKRGTERPFTGDLLDENRDGVYTCAACGEALFESETKFNSGTGMAEFSASTSSVAEAPDNSLGMQRTEVLCNKCGGHLGHVFSDGPLKLDNVIASIRGFGFCTGRKRKEINARY